MHLKNNNNINIVWLKGSFTEISLDLCETACMPEEQRCWNKSVVSQCWWFLMHPYLCPFSFLNKLETQQ